MVAGQDVSDGNASLLNGYQGPGADYPRKYIPGPLQGAYTRTGLNAADIEYKHTCDKMSATPNSLISKLLLDEAAATAKLLGSERISLRDNYLGEKGFIALLPLIDRNTRWTELDVSNNGLRNEAVVCLVDMLLRPQHASRPIRLDLSKNPISAGGAQALTELMQAHPRIYEINLRMTKVPRRTAIVLQEALLARISDRDAPAFGDVEETAENDGSQSRPGSAKQSEQATPQAAADDAIDAEAADT